MSEIATKPSLRFTVKVHNTFIWSGCKMQQLITYASLQTVKDCENSSLMIITFLLNENYYSYGGSRDLP